MKSRGIRLAASLVETALTLPSSWSARRGIGSTATFRSPLPRRARRTPRCCGRKAPGGDRIPAFRDDPPGENVARIEAHNDP